MSICHIELSHIRRFISLSLYGFGIPRDGGCLDAIPCIRINYCGHIYLRGTLSKQYLHVVKECRTALFLSAPQTLASLSSTIFVWFADSSQGADEQRPNALFSNEWVNSYASLQILANKAPPGHAQK
jgi:hypothetical protein